MRFFNNLFNFISLAIASTALYFALANHPALKLSANELVSITGLFITAIAFAIGTFFIVVAFSIYSYVRDIEKAKTRMEEAVTKTEDYENKMLNIQKEGDVILKNMVVMTDDFFSTQISFYRDSNFAQLTSPQKKLENKNKLDKLIKTRAQLALKYRFMERSRRINLLRELFAVGDISDVEPLRALVAREEDREIQKLANIIISKLIEKSKL